jgi:hypothetical protein
VATFSGCWCSCSAKSRSRVTVNFQIDGDKNKDAYTVYIDKVNFTYQ